MSAAAYQAIVAGVNSAINAGGITNPGQVGLGWPAATELVRMLAQANLQWIVSVYPLAGGRNETRYIADAGSVYTLPVLGVTCAFTGTVATFSGTTASTVNVHAFLLGQNVDAYAQLATGTSPAGCAAALASAINALGLSGISAAPSGGDVTLTGAAFAHVNLGGTGTIATEEGRICQGVQVSVWTPADPKNAILPGLPLTYPIGDAIIARLGQKTSLRLTASDGSIVFIRYRNDVPSDESQSSYSLYVRHIYFDVEFPVILTQSGTQVGGFRASASLNQQPATTFIFGGS